MQIYYFHPASSELTGSFTADENPMEPGQFLLPAYATPITPPGTGAHQTAVFIDGSWLLKADWRGIPLWHKQSRALATIELLGVLPDWTEVTDLEPASKLERFDGIKWVPNASAVRADKWEKVKAERDRLTQEGGYRVGEHWFHSDNFSRTQHIGLKDRARDMLAAGGTMAETIEISGESVQWKTMGGEFVVMTAQLAFNVVQAAGQSDAALFKTAEVHRDAMAASKTPWTYDVLAGWPLSFAG